MTHQIRENGYISITQMLKSHSVNHADQVAVRQKKHGIWQELTWKQYYDEIQFVGAGLLHLGINPDENIGIISENCEEWILAQFGVNYVNAVACGLYPTSPSNEILHLLTSSECRMVFCEDQEQLDKVLEIRDQLPLIRNIIVFDPKGLNAYDIDELITLDELKTLGRKKLSTEPDVIEEFHNKQTPESTALMVFTSGSTGLPKAAMISYQNIWEQMALLTDTLQSESGHNVLSYLPLCHVAEQAFSNMNAIASRMTVNFGESLRTIRTDLQEIAPHLFFGVPRIWEKMQAEITVLSSRAGPIRRALINRAMKSAQKRGETPVEHWTLVQRLKFQAWYWAIYRYLLNYLGLRKCKLAMTAAAPISPYLLAQLRGMGIPLVEIFGMTETTGAATIQPVGYNSQGRIGHPGSGVECKLASDGELLVKGGIVFKGYFNNQKATTETIQDGWLYTGDIAEQHEDGSFTIVDRKKDIMINAAGKNLSPSIIENTVKSSPYIKECICIGDTRKYVVALLQIDFDTVTTWAEEKQISYTTFKSLAENDQVRSMIEQEVELANAKLARVEQIKSFYLLPKELDHDDGEVTATMKVKRKNILKQYTEEVEALYS